MKEKSHKGQRHKGCGLCDREKRSGNAADRRPARDRRQGAASVADALDGKRRDAAQPEPSPARTP